MLPDIAHPRNYLYSVPRAEPWTIADVLDFEYFLAADSGEEAETLSDRDRELISATSTDRRTLFNRWLNARRASHSASLPGEQFRAGWQTLLILLSITGIALGSSLAAGLLHYKGDEPVNVAWFFAWTVGLQFIVLFAALLVWALRNCTGLLTRFHPLRSLLSAALHGLGTGLRKMAGAPRDQFRAGFANLLRQRELYGSLTTWPLLVATQLFAVCFNAGALLTLLAHVAMSDLAFGWQSTLHTSPEEVSRFVEIIAAPWSWLPHPHPSLAEIVESRFSYSEGIRPRAQPAMMSWWPFLCYAILFYGLLLRAALLMFASLKLRRSLSGLPFDHPPCNALFRRLSGPLIDADSSPDPLKVPASGNALAATHAAAGGRCLALIANDIDLPDDELKKYVSENYGWLLLETHRAPIDHPSGSAGAIAAVRNAAPQLASVLVVVRAHRSPIKAIALFLNKVADAAGARVEVLLLLTGQRDGERFAPVGEEEFSHWRNFNAIHHLHLGLEKWKAA